MKVYARQVAPDYQESPLFIDGLFPDNIVVAGNQDYKRHTIPAFDQIATHFDEMAGEWEDTNFYYQYDGNGKYTKVKKKPDCTIAELLRDYDFIREDGKAWSNRQKHEWRTLLESGAGADDDKTMLSCLSLITGKDWNCGVIRGCCQSDWNYIYYPTDEWTTEDIKAFETEYFNTGSEWLTYYEDEPEKEGCCIYCHSCEYEEIKKEIASAEGVEQSEVVLYAFKGWNKAAQYEAV